MKTKCFAWLLVLALLAGLLTGCASSSQTTAEPAAAQEPAASAEPAAQTEPAPAAEPEALPEPEPTQAPAASAEPAPEAEPAPGGPSSEEPGPEAPPPDSAAGVSTVPELPAQMEIGRSYPIEGTPEISMWVAYDYGAFGRYFEHFNDYPNLPYVREQTGADLQVTEVTVTVGGGTEQYNLMIAAGNYCDILPTSMYTGGAAQAYADEVIVDLTDDVPEYAPDFYARFSAYSPAEQFLGTVDGMLLYLPYIYGAQITDQGSFTRGDWLDELGLDRPTNQTEFVQMLDAMYEAYHPTHAIHMDPSCDSVGYATTWYETALFAVSGTDIACFRQGDTVLSGMTSDGYYDYLKWLIDLYHRGLINQDFYTGALGFETTPLIGGGNMAYWFGMADHMTSWQQYSDTGSFRAVPLPKLVGDNGIVYIAESPDISAGRGCPAISVDCDDVSSALGFLNWFFTDEGSMYANYGVEGQTYTLDEEGKIHYTDTILNNPLGMNSLTAFNIYGWSSSGSLQYQDRFLDTYAPEIRACVELWSDTSKDSSDLFIPAGAALSSEESDSITNQVTDICAYASEQILKWVTGAEVLDEAAWAEYCDALESLGLSSCVAVYQTAYDDYLEEFGA